MCTIVVILHSGTILLKRNSFTCSQLAKTTNSFLLFFVALLLFCTCGIAILNSVVGLFEHYWEVMWGELVAKNGTKFKWDVIVYVLRLSPFCEIMDCVI